MPDAELVNIKINGRDLQVPKGELIIESAKRIGVEIPFFCYHPRLSMEDGGANCRMCLVEVAAKGPDGTVRKMPKPQTGCSLPASEGMEVVTESEPLANDRRGVLEFILINHPLDCPICDRGGECPLQNNTIFYGPPTTRFIEEKRHFPKAYPLSEHVVFDRERCIHCARCTRFTTDISGDAQLAFLKRGADMEVATFEHTAYDSKFSGNVIELCPVGALLSQNYRFKARPWDLLTQSSICTQCANGCNIKLDYRVGQIQRVNARLNEQVNEEWTCDKGKFGMGYISDERRLKHPFIRRNGELVPATWREVNNLIVEKLREAGSAVGGIGGARSSNEDLYVWQRFFRKTLQSNNLDHRMGPHFPPVNDGLYKRFGYHSMGNSIADMERMKTIFVIGSNLADEQPILFLRVRKAWRFKGASVVEANSANNYVSEFASVSLRHRPGTEISLINGLITVMLEENLLSEDRLNGFNDLATFKSSIGNTTPTKMAEQSGVSEDQLRRAARLIVSGEAAFIAGAQITSHGSAADVLTALGNLAALTGNTDNLNVPVTVNNQQGAMDMGILPDCLPGYESAETLGLNTKQMLDAAASGKLKILWLVGTDLVNDFYDPELAHQSLEACSFVIVNELFLTDTTQMGDVVLPVQSVAERDGTYTNIERRVQWFHKAFEIAPTIRPDWLVFSEIQSRLGGPEPYFSARDVLKDITQNVPIYKDCTAEDLGEGGIRWTYREAERPAAELIPIEYKSPAVQKA